MGSSDIYFRFPDNFDLSGLTLGNGNLDTSTIGGDDASSYVSKTKKSPYTSDERKGTTNTKTSNVTIDTSTYDAALKDLQDQISAIGYIGSTTPTGGASTKNGKINWSYVSADEAAANKAKQAQKDALQAQINELQSQRSNYIKNNSVNNSLSSATTAADQALTGQAASDNAVAQANQTANINAGINKARAGMLGSQEASKDTTVQNGLYSANSSNRASTQADYLNRIGQADSLDITADAMNTAAGKIGLSGALQGAASGAAMGATISDENMKEAPSASMDDLIAQFKSLYSRLKELKKDYGMAR